MTLVEASIKPIDDLLGHGRILEGGEGSPKLGWSHHLVAGLIDISDGIPEGLDSDTEIVFQRVRQILTVRLNECLEALKESVVGFDSFGQLSQVSAMLSVVNTPPLLRYQRQGDPVVGSNIKT